MINIENQKIRCPYCNSLKVKIIKTKHPKGNQHRCFNDKCDKTVFGKPYFYKNKFRSIHQIAELENVKPYSVYSLLYRNNGIMPKTIILKKANHLHIKCGEEKITLFELFQISGVPYRTIRARYEKGIRCIDELLKPHIPMVRPKSKTEEVTKGQLETLAEFDKLTANDRY